MKHSIPILVFVCLMMPLAAMAQSFELTPFVGYQFGGDFQQRYGDGFFDNDTRDLDEGESYGLIADFAVSRHFQVELLYSQQETQLKTFDGFAPDRFDLDVRYMHAGILWQFRNQGLRPYIAGSIGGTRFDFADLGDETRFSTSFGGGVKAMVNDNLGFRFEGRAYTTFVNDGDNAVCGRDVCFVYNDETFLYQWDVKFGVTFAF